MSSSWQFERTEAFRIFSTTGVGKDRLMLRLMHHALLAAEKSPTRDMHRLHDAENADYAAELKTNHELHASLDCIRHMLKDLHDPVEPHGTVTANDGTIWTPAQKAATIAQSFPQLGQYMQRHLQTHQQRLLFKAGNPEIWEEAYQQKRADAALAKNRQQKHQANNMDAWDRFLAR